MFFSHFLAFHSLFLKHDYQIQAGLSHILFNTITETNDPIHSLISNLFFLEFKLGKISNTEVI